jgi:hypothetical protein
MRHEKSQLAFVEISPELESDREIRPLIERARDALRAETRDSFDLVNEEWDIAQDSRDRRLIRLRIHDAWGEATTSFAPIELGNEAQMSRRMNHLWGDVLSKATKTLINKFREENLQPVGG